MRGEYVTATIRREVNRARRDGRPIDREWLRVETGISWARLEACISTFTQQAIHAEADPMPEQPQGPFPPIKFWPADWKGKR